MGWLRKIIDGKSEIGKLNELELGTGLRNIIWRMREDLGDLDYLLNAVENRQRKCNIIEYSNPVISNIGIGGVSDPIYFQVENLRGDYVHSKAADGTIIHSQVCGVGHIHAFLWGYFDSAADIDEIRLAVYRNGTRWLPIDRYVTANPETTFQLNGGTDVPAACGDQIDLRLENIGLTSIQNFTSLKGWMCFHHVGDCTTIINEPI